MAQITLHRALSKRTVLPSEIQRKKQITTFMVANKRSNPRINGISVEDTGKNIQAAYASINAQFAELEKLVKAIALSNSTTNVTIGGKTFTVTEAIQMKKVIAAKREYLEAMKRDYRNATIITARENEALAQKATEFARAQLGEKRDAAVKPEALETLIKIYTEAHEYTLIDPLGLAEVIDKFETELVAFESEVDAVLSESNATTFVEVG